MKIDVTWEDIYAGVAKNACKCPVALALRRASRIEDTSCSRDYFWIAGRGLIKLPKIARDAIQHYDSTGQMEPFSFEVPNV